MSNFYSCKMIGDDEHNPIGYEIYDPNGIYLATVVKFEEVETLLRHLNAKIKTTLLV